MYKTIRAFNIVIKTIYCKDLEYAHIRYIPQNMQALRCVLLWFLYRSILPISFRFTTYTPGQTITMMTSSNRNIVRITGPLWGEFTAHRWITSQRPVTRSFDVFFDWRLNKQLSKQSQGWRFETPSRSLWRHRDVPGSVKQNWTTQVDIPHGFAGNS